MRKRTRRRRFDLDAHPVRRALVGHRPASDEELLCVQAAELARQGIGPEVLPLVPAARRIVEAAAADPVAAATDAAGLASLRDLLDLHDQQRRAVPAVDYAAAIHAAVNLQRW